MKAPNINALTAKLKKIPPLAWVVIIGVVAAVFVLRKGGGVSSLGLGGGGGGGGGGDGGSTPVDPAIISPGEPIAPVSPVKPVTPVTPVTPVAPIKPTPAPVKPTPIKPSPILPKPPVIPVIPIGKKPVLPKPPSAPFPQPVIPKAPKAAVIPKPSIIKTTPISRLKLPAVKRPVVTPKTSGINAKHGGKNIYESNPPGISHGSLTGSKRKPATPKAAKLAKAKGLPGKVAL